MKFISYYLFVVAVPVTIAGVWFLPSNKIAAAALIGSGVQVSGLAGYLRHQSEDKS